VIVCSLRHLPPATSLDLARLAVDFRNDGRRGLRPRGRRGEQPAAAHADAFLYAREHDLACTCHAGEGDGPDRCGRPCTCAARTASGHGTHLIADPSLTQYVNDRASRSRSASRATCQTRASASYEAHPFRAYFDAGLNVVLNTDNRLMSGTTLVDEYAHAAEHLGFTAAELAQVARNGFASAFLPFQERQALLARVDAEIAGLVDAAPVGS
jgi:adenosine deaminase